MDKVYLLYHIHEMDNDDEDVKLIGVYSSLSNAEEALLRVAHAPGFRENPEGFQIHAYKLDKDSWTEGFVTVENDAD